MISQQYTLKELGIHVDNQLRFTNHVNQIVAKTHVRSRRIHECFLSKDRSAIDKACVTYVRPLLEYSYIWSPYQSENICTVESVQRRFTKTLNGLTGYSYSRRLAILGLESLKLRRLHQNLIYTTYKAIFGLIDIDCSKFFTVSPYSSTPGHDKKLS